MKDYDIALLAQQDKMDIAVVLKGYTKDCQAGFSRTRGAYTSKLYRLSRHIASAFHRLYRC